MLATCHSLSRMPAIRDSALTHRIDEFEGTEERHLYYSPAWQVLEERISDTPVTQYVWSPVYIDAMILRDRSVSGELDERIWVTHDANFNVTMLMDVNGDMVERFTYTPFGVATVHAPDFAVNGRSGVEWQYRHQGGRWSAESGLGKFRNRDFSAFLGRWIKHDPIGYTQGGNLYTGLSNDPLNNIDPLGLASTSVSGNALIDAWMLDIQARHGIAKKQDEAVPAYLKRIASKFLKIEQYLLYGLLIRLKTNEIRVDFHVTCSCKDGKFTMKENAALKTTGQTEGKLDLPTGITITGLSKDSLYEYEVVFDAIGHEYNHDAMPPFVCADITMSVTAKIGIYSFKDGFKVGRICATCGVNSDGVKDDKGVFQPSPIK